MADTHARGVHAAHAQAKEQTGALDHLFMGLPMTWPRVIVFAVVVGAVTAALNLVPALKDTSATDVAVSYEWWLLFGVIVATNCERPVEAGLKTFVFFLVSQPLIYLIEMPFVGPSVWSYLPYWLGATVACLPAGMLANRMRERGILGTIALVMALAMLAFLAGDYGWKAWYLFPRHLFTALFVLVEMVAFAVEFSRPGRARVAMLVVTAALLAASVVYQLRGYPASSNAAVLPEGTWTATLDGPGSVEIEGDQLDYSSNTVGSGTVTCTDADGHTIVFDVGMDGRRVVYIKQR